MLLLFLPSTWHTVNKLCKQRELYIYHSRTFVCLTFLCSELRMKHIWELTDDLNCEIKKVIIIITCIFVICRAMLKIKSSLTSFEFKRERARILLSSFWHVSNIFLLGTKISITLTADKKCVCEAVDIFLPLPLPKKENSHNQNPTSITPEM